MKKFFSDKCFLIVAEEEEEEEEGEGEDLLVRRV
jgi:hypothetical protein